MTSRPRTKGSAMSKVLYEKRDRIAYVTLNRPEAKNAIDPEVHELLWQTWEDFRDDDAVDVAILTGTGDAFCAGADLKTYIPPLMGTMDSMWIRRNVATGIGGRPRAPTRRRRPGGGAAAAGGTAPAKQRGGRAAAKGPVPGRAGQAAGRAAAHRRGQR